MRVTILGATGLLGKALMREWQGDEVSGFGSRDADIRSEHQISPVIAQHRPDWIVLAAAYTDVDGCEINRGLAFEVNTVGAVNVARAAKKAGCRLLLLSSDYVFDGTKTTPYETSDTRSPRSVYGKTKAQAEEQISGMLPNSCIVRTSWLFGTGGKCFPDTILNLAAARDALDVVDDQRGCPTYSRDLARAIVQLCGRNATGIVHVSNEGDCTWFEFAREIIRSAGLNTTVRPTTSDKFVRPAERPKYSVLAGISRRQYGIAMPPWQDALHRYLADRRSSGGSVAI